MKKRVFLIISVLVIMLSFLAYAGVFQDATQVNFNLGSYFNTFYNSTVGAVQLNISQNFLNGGYTSRIFNPGGNATWVNFSWMQEVCYRCQLPSNQQTESGDFLRSANMGKNVLLLRLNENAGATAFADNSGNGNNGTCNSGAGNCPTTGVAGKFSAAADFESTGADDFLNFSNPNSLNNFGNAISMEAWIKPESISGEPTIIDKDFASQFSFFIDTPTNKLAGYIVNSSGSQNLLGNFVFSVNNWYHVAMVYNGSDIRLYTNGVLDGTPVNQTGNIAVSGKNLLVGAGWSGASITFPFDGLIDEVAIYNRSLSEQEIRDHYLRGVLDLNLSARVCEDAACAGNSFVAITGNSPQTLSLASNQYFQYKFNFTTENTTAGPMLYNTTISYNFTDNVPPSFSGFIENPINGTSYASGATYRFNATITAIEGGRAGIEFAGVNYSVTNASDLFTFTRTNLNAGVYPYYWWANDTVGNYNTGGLRSYTVSRAVSELNLTLNGTEGNRTIFIGQSLLLNGTLYRGDTGNLLRLYNNGNLIGQNAVEVSNLTQFNSLGTFNITVLYLQSQNYSSGFKTYFVNVLPLIDNEYPTFSNLGENPANGTSYAFGATYQFNTTIISTNGSVGFTFNGINYSSSSAGNSYVTNVTNLGSGTYPYYWFAYSNGTNHYLNVSSVRFYTVTAASPNLVLKLNDTQGDISFLVGGQVNASAFSSTNYVELYRDGTNVSTQNNQYVSLGVGYYNYTAIAYTNQNYSGAITSRFLNVTIASGSVTLLLNGNAGNLSAPYPQETNVSASTPYGNVSIYRNGAYINAENGLNVTRGVEFYNITAISTGDANHSSASATYYLNITKAGSSIFLYLNNSRSNTTINNGSSLEINSTLQTGSGNLEVYVDNSLIYLGQSPSYNLTSFNSNVLFNVTALYKGNQNYSSSFETWFVNVTSPPGGVNASPVAHWNYTIVNNSVKIPVYGDNFFIQANISDPENDTLTVNFTITAPNGTNVVNNVLGAYYSVGNYRIWNSTAYNVNDYGYWNWSYVASDGVNSLQQGGSFRVLSDLALFPDEYIVSSDPKNQTLIWNLSTYHNSLENYNFIFNYTLNSTFFTLSFTNNSVGLNSGVYNSSNLFKNQVVISVDGSVAEGVIYYGNITAQRTLDGKNYTVPLKIGINPPSGDPDAFNNNTLALCTKEGNCNINIQMENDETKTFTWVINNSGNFSLTSCRPSVSGFDITNFGSFSSNNFNLGIGEATGLSLTISQPSINSYYGKLELECTATVLGFNNSLGAESDNAPSLQLIIIADSGQGTTGGTTGPPGPNGGSGGGSFGGGIVLQRADLALSILETLSLGRGDGEIISFEAKNTGNKFLNRCRVGIGGEIAEWISNRQSESIAPGQRVEYFLEVNTPLDARPGTYSAEISVFCDEISKIIPLNVDVVVGEFDLNILSSVRAGTDLAVTYAIEDFSGIDTNYEVKYSFARGEVILVDGTDSVFGRANQREVYTLEFELPKNSVGQFKIILDASNGDTNNRAESNVVLNSRGIAGFAISDQNLRALGWFGTVILVLAALYFVSRFLRKHYKNTELQEGRSLINVDLSN